MERDDEGTGMAVVTFLNWRVKNGSIVWLWHAFGESSSVREKKSFGQSSQREGCSSNVTSVERILELMGLKSQEEVGSGSNIAPPLKGAKAHTASLCATRSPSGHEVWLEGM